jgi:FkbM family methyltransferase
MRRLVSRALDRLGYRVQSLRYVPPPLRDARHLRALAFDDVVCRRMVEQGRPLGFVQIGAFDGVTADPLRTYIQHHGWRGVLVEPQPLAAAALRRLYDGNGAVTVLEAAVAPARGRRTLFSVDGGGLPDWARGLASFDRAHLEKHEGLAPGISAHIRAGEVACVTIDDVLDAAGPGPIDLLQIDAEGEDARILAGFPFERVAPAIVHFEIKNLAYAERAACLDRLARFGYRFAASGDEDMLAVGPGA